MGMSEPNPFLHGFLDGRQREPRLRLHVTTEEREGLSVVWYCTLGRSVTKFAILSHRVFRNLLSDFFGF